VEKGELCLLFKRRGKEIIDRERIWHELKWHAYLSPIFIVACLIIFLWPTSSEADLPGWSYHKTIIVRENSGSDLYDYQIKVILNSENFDFSKANPDGSDLRFLDSGASLNYWIERWVYGNEAIIWVKIPHISPYEEKEIDLYYGNPSATSESNLQATMDFFEVRKINTTDTVSTGEDGNNPSTWTWDNITLSTTFTNPVVVAQYPSYNNTESAVVRIKDATSTSLSLRIIEPSLRDNVHPSETVGIIVLNEGTYQFLDGTRIEAHKYETRSTVGKNVSNTWDGKFFSLTYSNTGSDPVIFAQPMTSNDTTQEARFLKTRLSDLRDNDGYFQLALEEEYDNTTQRANTETVAWIAVERNGTTGTVTGTISGQTNDSTPTPYEVGVSYDNVQGIGNSWTTVSFAQNFTTAPVIILSYGSYDEEDNSEIRYQNETTQSFQVAIEEDYTRGSAMETTTTHSTEDAFYLAFGEEGLFPIAKRVDPEPTVVVLGIKGKVFEDADAGGNAYTAGEDEVKSGVDVRLYRDADGNNTLSSGDVFIAETQTNSSGNYYLPGKEGNTYFVVVDSKDIKPAPKDNGYNGESTQGVVWAEQTYEKEYIGGVYLEQQKYGGENAQVSDNFTSSTTVTDNNYEHVARVDLDVERVLGIDFGFSFEVVTNTRDGDDDASNPRTVQGSLRQVLQNANAIKDGQSIVFRIPTTDPNYNSASNEFVITPSQALPSLTDDSTVIDGNTQSAYNEGRIVLDGSAISADGITIKAYGTSVKNLTIKKFNRGVSSWGWQYQRPITINYTGSTTLTEYQLLVTITPSNFDYSKANSDGSDVRFISEDGKVLDYWIHNWSTTGTSRIWVKIPTITPSSITTVTMLYGNSAASSAESSHDTFSYSELKKTKYVVSRRNSANDLAVLAELSKTTIRNDSSNEEVVLNGGEYHVFSKDTIFPTSTFSSNKPFYSSFQLSTSEMLVPISFASTSFVYTAQRGTPEIDVLSPFTDTTVTINVYLTSGILDTAVTTQLAQGNVFHYEIGAVPRVIIIESQDPVLATFDATDRDSFVMHPATTELFGVGSQNAYVAALNDNTSITAYLTYESGTQTVVNFTLNRGESTNVASSAPFPFDSQGSGPAIHLIADKPIGAIQQADGDGLESTAFWTRENLNSCVGIPQDAQYVAISAPYPNTQIYILEPDGTTQAPVASVQASSEYPGKFFFGSTTNGVYIPRGSVIYSNKPFYAYYENSTPNNEQLAEGPVQGRQLAFSEPQVSLGSEGAADSNILIQGNKFIQNNKGVSVSNGNGIKIFQNTFSQSTVLPIDLGDDSTVTPNDGIVDISLVNKGMDYPVITHAELDPRGWSLYVEGYIGTDPTSPTEQANFSGCTIEVYTSSGDFSGYGEGSKYLGSGQTTSTNSFAFTIDVRNKGVTRGSVITALAVHPDPATSEFSQNTTVAGGPVISNVWAKHIYYNREATSPPPPQTTITWNTDIPATSQVVYDTTSHASPTAAYAYSSPVNLTPTTSHVVTITNVATNTLYFYRVKSTSTEGYLSISPEFKLPPGGTSADTDLCASCHRGHTAPHLAIPPQKNATPLLLPLISNP
jgi:hypothetical protein